jgi:iron complex outermembrane receptor protein
MSSNDISLSGRLPEYYMNNIGIEKMLSCKFGEFSLKLSINNLFDEEYLSVLSRPMPGINYELFAGFKF